MRVILDTSALFYPRGLERLRDRTDAGEIVIPVVVLLERARQLHAAGRDGLADMVRLAHAGGWRLEEYGALEARRTLGLAGLSEPAWRRLARDAMIVGHVHGGDALWTANPDDFLALGLAPGQVLDVRAL
jgi:predicted nucleic acid-binding protein